MEGAAGVLVLVAARAEAAQVTNQEPDGETPPAGFLATGRPFSYLATAREFPRRRGCGPGQGIAPGRLRPYNEVLGEYAEQARDHMERSPVPQGYKDLVRRYFAELER